ncbi:MAG: fibrobacter succinogenes major paralogous domain-containing protein, partial [Calditrichaceae bacterium]
KLKETGTTHWNSPNFGANNTSGFTALPGGSRYFDGTFYSMCLYGYWWSSTESSSDYAWYRSLGYDYSRVYRDDKYKQYGFSVRLVRD